MGQTQSKVRQRLDKPTLCVMNLAAPPRSVCSMLRCVLGCAFSADVLRVQPAPCLNAQQRAFSEEEPRPH